jgi:hypothetical protein
MGKNVIRWIDAEGNLAEAEITDTEALMLESAPPDIPDDWKPLSARNPG